jgi:hypothetical protein
MAAAKLMYRILENTILMDDGNKLMNNDKGLDLMVGEEDDDDFIC